MCNRFFLKHTLVTHSCWPSWGWGNLIYPACPSSSLIGFPWSEFFCCGKKKDVATNSHLQLSVDPFVFALRECQTEWVWGNLRHASSFLSHFFPWIAGCSEGSKCNPSKHNGANPHEQATTDGSTERRFPSTTKPRTRAAIDAELRILV